MHQQAILSKLPGVLHEAVSRIKYDFGSMDFNARLSSSLDLAVIQAALVEWQLLSQQETVARLSSHVIGTDRQAQPSPAPSLPQPHRIDAANCPFIDSLPVCYEVAAQHIGWTPLSLDDAPVCNE